MARKFLDTSALVKFYRQETEAATVTALLADEDIAVLSELTPLEFRSAFYGHVRQGSMTIGEAKARISEVASDRADYEFVPLSELVLNRAAALLDLHAIAGRLRPLDAIQLASALEENGRSPLAVFLTTDDDLAIVARAGGLTVQP